MRNIEEGFWLVWNPVKMPPMHMHETYEQAVAEASRLARSQKGDQFFVLQAIEKVCVADVVRTKLEPPLPF